MDTQCPHCGPNNTKSRVAVYETGTRKTSGWTLFSYRRFGWAISGKRSRTLLADRAGPGGWLFVFALIAFLAGYTLFAGLLLVLALMAAFNSGYGTEWICFRCGKMFTLGDDRVQEK